MPGNQVDIRRARAVDAAVICNQGDAFAAQCGGNVSQECFDAGNRRPSAEWRYWAVRPDGGIGAWWLPVSMIADAAKRVLSMGGSVLSSVR